ncbi:MAG: putative abductin-like protein [bacterium]|nr:putative abductin-like protein [bacterium]
MSVIRCPHCKAELPEKASFCARCGRRIEGWSVSRDATPAMGESALPGGDEATRQMQPTPSLLRAAAISVKKGGARPRKRSKLPLVAGMLVVAAAGAAGGFLIVRARMKKQLSAVSHQPSAPISVAPPIVKNPSPPTPNAQPPTPNVPAKTIVRKNKAGKRAHVIGAVPVPVTARASSSGGLPHKQVATDSKAMQMPTVQHESATEAAPPPSEAEQKQEGEATVDADSVRFVVRAHLPQVRACYGRAFKDSSPGGSVEIGFAIDPTGHAKNVRTETNTTDSEGLAHCLEARVREWQFPKPVGGDYELIYPFVFAPGS